MSDVVIIKKQSLILDHLIHILEKQIHKSVTAYEPGNYQAVFDRQTLPDTILIEMENERFFEMVQLIKTCSHKNNVQVIVWLTKSLKKDQVAELFSLNSDGYFHPEMEQQEISYAIQTVFNRQRYIHPKIAILLLDEYLRITNNEEHRPIGLLTKREWQVLELITQGKTTRHIGKQLYISTKTVTNHVASILRKLDVEDRTNAALLAIKNRWIII